MRSRRRAWLAALPVPCIRCGGPVEHWHEWHLAHPIPRPPRRTNRRHAAPAHDVCLEAAPDVPVARPFVIR